MRRRIRTSTAGPGILLAGALLLTAACSSAAPSARPSGTPTPTGPTLLSFAVYGPPQVITAYTKIAADFSATRPDTVVNIQPYDTHAEAAAALHREFAAGDPPDAFIANLADLPDLVANGSIQRIDDLLGERRVDFGDGYQRNSLEAFSADNALQCMPVDTSPLVVYYNTRLIHPAALTKPGETPITADGGWTLDQFAAAARSVRGRGVRGLYVAPTLEQVAPFLLSGGGHLADDPFQPTTLQLSDGSSEAAIEKLLEVVRDPQLTFSEQELTRRSALQRFKAGKLGMILGFRDLTPQLREQQDLSFDVLPLPRLSSKVTVGVADGVCLSKDSTEVEKTADFLAYLVSDDASALLAATGYMVPANLDVANSPAFLQPGQQPAGAAVFTTNIRRIQPLPTSALWPRVAARASRMLTGLFYDPVIDPLDVRLKAIDAASALILAPTPSPTPSPSPTS